MLDTIKKWVLSPFAALTCYIRPNINDLLLHNASDVRACARVRVWREKRGKEQWTQAALRPPQGRGIRCSVQAGGSVSRLLAQR